MKELSWRCFRHKIDWRRLFLLVAIFTVSGFVFQFLVHSYVISPNKQFHDETDSWSNRSLNSTVRSNEFLKGTILQQVHLTLPNSVVSPNSSNKFVQSVEVVQESVQAQAQRKKNSVSGSKDKNLANTTSSHHEHVSSGKQVEFD